VLTISDSGIEAPFIAPDVKDDDPNSSADTETKFGNPGIRKREKKKRIR